MKKILAGLALVGVLALSSCGNGYSAGESTTKQKVKVEYCAYWEFEATPGEANEYYGVSIDKIFIGPCEGYESLYVVNEEYLNNEVIPNLEYPKDLKMYTFTEGTDKLVLAKVDVSTYKEEEHNGHKHYITYIEQ